MARRRHLLTAAAVALLFLGADQVTKLLAEHTLRPGHQVTMIGGWLWFELVSNSGATLGILRGHNLLFLAVSALLVGAVVAILLRGGASNVVAAAALGAVAGGTTGNLMDRIRLGHVIDFINVRVWPATFNLADAAIRIGVVVFVLALLIDLGRRPRSAGRPAAD
jgi:signal peptidase II